VKKLGPFLDQLALRYSNAHYLGSDPLEFVHRYQNPWDQEAVALLAAVLAYGNVKQIRSSVASALALIQQAEPLGPAAWVRGLGQAPGARRRAETLFSDYVHRFNVGSDLVVLFSLLSRSWQRHGSLGSHFLKGLSPEHPTIEGALNRLMTDWKNEAAELGALDSFHYLLTAPQDGSCCKRWCMFLRWMGRHDSVDPGLWGVEAASELVRTFPEGRRLRADQLVMPLDTHTGRISQYLGLTERKSLGWKAAIEITEKLRQWEPRDPVRYDFALARLGILDLCQKRYRVEICSQCELRPGCRFGGAKERKA
jgi:uncharacterized protein (TIGR02757 family)